MNKLNINRPSMHDDETIDSFVYRSAVASYYDPVEMFFRSIRSGFGVQVLDYTIHPLIYERISIRTETPIAKLHDGSVHRFSKVLTPPGESIEHMTFRSGDILPILSNGPIIRHVCPSADRQYCPPCLKQSKHFRVSWLLDATAICLNHQCLLVRGCASCGKKVSTRDINSGHCTRCNFDLGSTLTMHVDADESGLLSQQLIQMCLMENQMDWPDINLPSVSPRALFRVIYGLRAVVKRIEAEWPYHHQLPTTLHKDLKTAGIEKALANYLSYATAFKAIKNWPTSFYELLDNLRIRKPSAQRAATISDDFGRNIMLWLDKFWVGQEMRFIQDSFDEYLVNFYPPSFSLLQSERYRNNLWLGEHLPYMSVPEAEEFLQVSQIPIQNFIEDGRLRIFASYLYGNKKLVFLTRTDVLDLKQLRDNALGTKQVSKQLGVDRTVIVKLIEEGVLTAFWGTEISMSKGWRVIEGDLKDFCSLVNAKVRTGIFVQHQCLTIRQVSTTLSFYRINIAKIIGFVIEGRLPTYRNDPTDYRISSLWFFKEDVETIKDEITSNSGLISRQKVLNLLKIVPQTLRRYIESGFLQPHMKGPNVYFDTNEVAAFKDSYVNTDRAAEILGVGRITVQRWARQGTIESVSGPGINGTHFYLFSLQFLLNWRQSRISYNEARQILGVNRYRLEKLIAQGEIQPESNSEHKHRFFAKDDVLQLRDKLGVNSVSVSVDLKSRAEVSVSCPHCGRSENQRLEGLTEAGSQRYHCNVCCRTYTPFPILNAYGENYRNEAVQLRAEGMSIKSVAEKLGVSEFAVTQWIKQHKIENED